METPSRHRLATPRTAAGLAAVLGLALSTSGCIAAVPLAVQAGAAAVGAAAAARRVASARKPAAPQTQLQVRELQTRSFEGVDPKRVLKVMIAVLQDDGFILRDADAELGLLSASKEMNVETSEAVFWGSLVGGSWEKGAVVEATANVVEDGDKVRFRVNFQKKIYDSAGELVEASAVAGPVFYHEVFSKVSKGLFIEEQEL